MSLSSRPGLSDLGVLARLELAQAASFARQGGRDPLLVAGLAALVLAAGFGANQLAAVALKQPAGAALIALAGWGAASLALLQASRGGYAERLLAGPFQPVVAGRGALMLWLAIRGLTLVTAGAALAALAVLPTGVLVAAATLATGAAGALLGAVAGTLGSPRLRRPAIRRSAARRRNSTVLTHRAAALVAWAQLRRPSGFGPVYAIALAFLALAAAAGAVATRNSGADAGVLVVAAFSLPAIAPVVAIDAALAQLIGRQPVSTGRVLAVWLAPMLLLPLLLAAVGLIAGVGLARSAAVAIGLTLGAAAGRLVLLLHMLARSARAAGLAASVDGMLAAGLGFILPWALLLAPLRFALLVRRAGRVRWLER